MFSISTYPSQNTIVSTTANSSSMPPKKYIKIDGVTQINPAYKAYEQAHGRAATSALNPERALVVVSNMEQHQQLREVSLGAGQGDVILASATDATIEMIQEPEIYRQVGLSPDAMVDSLGAIFAKYEIPMGLMNKLSALTEYDGLQFIIDDSGSMRQHSNAKNSSGQLQTRWEEAHSRMKELIEIMAYVPTPKITICFLNRKDTIHLERRGESPETFINDTYRQLDKAFFPGPSGSTPIVRCLTDSFARDFGKRIARYLFCDGMPDGGDVAKETIMNMVAKRSNPQGNPLTFLSCTDEDDQVEWMKEVEERASYCAEYDDFYDEAKEVLRDQGAVLPFTKGFHLIGQLVGAMNPDDLDALDESVPLTKWTLDNILGVQTTEQEYRKYFEGFKEAQGKRILNSNIDRLKVGQDWEPFFGEFMFQPLAKNIAAVRQFKQQLEQCAP